MSIIVLQERPNESELMTLAEHQASTPATFSLEENPVLHYKSVGAQLTSSVDLPGLPANEVTAADFYVCSSQLMVWFANRSGLTIPYPSISLHAIQGGQPRSLYLQIEPQGGIGQADGQGKDSDFNYAVIELTIVTQDDVQEFYDALTRCASLHRDYDDDNDDDDENEGIIMGSPTDDHGDMGPWITAENFEQGEADDIGEYNGLDDEELAGVEVEIEESIRAGIRRGREEDDGEDGARAESEDAKWRRINEDN